MRNVCFVLFCFVFEISCSNPIHKKRKKKRMWWMGYGERFYEYKNRLLRKDEDVCVGIGKIVVMSYNWLVLTLPTCVSENALKLGMSSSKHL